MKKLLSVIISVAAALLIVSFAIAVPITSRQLYYYCVDKLDIEKSSGLPYSTIVESYDELMDYLHGKGEFSVGSLSYSEDGKAHFEDCEVLFDLDYAVLFISAAVLLISFFLSKKIKPYRFFGLSPVFYSGAGVLLLFGILAVLGFVNFDLLFTLFHNLFFPGKTNWIFSPADDPIIRILPQQFFAICAVIIAAIIICLSLAFIIYGVLTRGRKNENG